MKKTILVLSLVLVGRFFVAGAQASSDIAPLAWWNFGTAGKAEYGPGKLSQALSFDGESVALEAGTLGSFNAMTVAFWLRLESLDRPYQAIMACRGWNGTAPHLLVVQSGQLRFAVKDAQPMQIGSRTSLSGRLGQWVHVALTYDRTSGQLRYFVDGRLDLEHAMTMSSPVEMRDVWIGGWSDEARFLHGALDDVRVYRQVLSADAIQALAAGKEVDGERAAWWKLDGDASDATGKHPATTRAVTEQSSISQVTDKATRRPDRGVGFLEYVDGVKGRGLKFDGFTACVIRDAASVPAMGEAFTCEAWVAPQEYPWNWTAILNQEQGHKAGWFFGISGEGRVGLHVAKDGQWLECNSTSQIPLLKWSHVMGTYDAREGLKVYVNGKLERAYPFTGLITLATNAEVWMGKSQTSNFPIRTERAYSATFLSPMVFDGLFDEVKVYGKALSESEVATAYAAVQPTVAQPLEFRVLPSGPEGTGEFGAVYTRLKYAPEWERHWRVGEDSDILVRFDESPSRIVFWRGMNYGAAYVSENGLWAGDQSLEVNSAETGCYEHMADKRCEFSTAKIIENNDARVVVHARYACVGIDGKFLWRDPLTGWGLWADEYFTIYPDGVAVRHVVAENYPGGGGQWQETLLYNQPGSRPEDTVELAALTLANENGESRTYSWENGPPLKWKDPRSPERYFQDPAGANIQLVNFRSNWKPYLIFEPGVRIEGMGIPPSTDYSKFPCWNHWPVAQLPNDGRKAIVSDRPSHFSLSSSVPMIRRDPNRSSATFLYGMTDQPITNLVPLSKSWNAAPAATLAGSGFSGGKYDKNQRAYVFSSESAKVGALEFTLEANGDSPVHNPAFVVKNWGDRSARLQVNGRDVPRGKEFRYGHHRTVGGTDLVVWIKHAAMEPVRIVLSE